MASAEYIVGRKQYARPQAMLWAEDPGGVYVLNENTPEEALYYAPTGYELVADLSEINGNASTSRFIILSDDNRSPIDIKINRIEKRERMINGRMRSYHTADKLSVTVSWTMLPSRAFANLANFNTATGKSPMSGQQDAQFTTDGGAGGVDMLNWYENHSDPFWVYLAYDKHNVYGNTTDAFGQLAKYNQVVEMYFADFSYSVVKRGASNYDFWNVSVTLEEV